MSQKAALFVLVLCSFQMACRNKETSAESPPKTVPIPPPPGPLVGSFFPMEFVRDGSGKATDVITMTLSGRGASVTFTPIPSHAWAHTGSPGLENKVNFGAYPFLTPSEMEEVGGNGNGVCEGGEACLVSAATAVLHRVPLSAPVRMRLQRVAMYGRDTEQLGGDKHWGVRLEVGDVMVEFGHLGWLGPSVIEKLEAVGVTGLDDFAGPLDSNLVPEGAQIILEPGDVIGMPQIRPLCFAPNQPNQCSGFHQIEFIISQTVEPKFDGDNIPRDASPYRYMTAEQRQALSEVMDYRMTTESSIYAGHARDKWMWAGEAALEPVSAELYENPDSIFGRFGEWYENQGGRGVCNEPEPFCDDALFVWPLLKTSSQYSASLYHSAATSALVVYSQKRHPVDGERFVIGEIVSPSLINEKQDGFIAKWRMKGVFDYGPQFQGFRFALDENRVLRMRKTAEFDNEADANDALAALADPAGATCDGTSVICLTRSFAKDFPGGN